MSESTPGDHSIWEIPSNKEDTDGNVGLITPKYYGSLKDDPAIQERVKREAFAVRRMKALQGNQRGMSVKKLSTRPQLQHFVAYTGMSETNNMQPRLRDLVAGERSYVDVEDTKEGKRAWESGDREDEDSLYFVGDDAYIVDMELPSTPSISPQTPEMNDPQINNEIWEDLLDKMSITSSAEACHSQPGIANIYINRKGSLSVPAIVITSPFGGSTSEIEASSELCPTSSTNCMEDSFLSTSTEASTE